MAGGTNKRQRTNQTLVRFTADEFTRVAEKADKTGLALAAFLRAAALGEPGPRAKRRPPADREALLRVLGELGRVGNNVNQIAYRLNTGQQADSAEVRHACQEIVAVMDLLRAALGHKPPEPPRSPDDYQGQQPDRP